LHRLEHASLLGALTAYLLQQIQLPAHRDSDRLAPWSATGNRSAEPTFQFGYEACRSQRAPGVSWGVSWTDIEGTDEVTTIPNNLKRRATNGSYFVCPFNAKLKSRKISRIDFFTSSCHQSRP
jgi:hypothetical protein